MLFTYVVAVVMLCAVATVTVDNCASPEFQVSAQLMKTIYIEDTKLTELNILHSSEYRNTLHNSPAYLHFMFDRSFTHGGSKYLWSRYDGTDFHLASLGCAFYGGQLVEVNDEPELMAVRSFTKSNARLNCVYIGMDKQPDGNWYYTHSKSRAYNLFGSVSLDNGKDSNCASLWQGEDWLMDDMPCHFTCHVLCEVQN